MRHDVIASFSEAIQRFSLLLPGGLHPPGTDPPQVCLPSLLRAFLGRVSSFLLNFQGTPTQDVLVLRGLARRPASHPFRYIRNFGGPRGALSTSNTEIKITALRALTFLLDTVTSQNRWFKWSLKRVNASSDVCLIKSDAG